MKKIGEFFVTSITRKQESYDRSTFENAPYSDIVFGPEWLEMEVVSSGPFSTDFPVCDSGDIKILAFAIPEGEKPEDYELVKKMP